jgi:hypothetical protein
MLLTNHLFCHVSGSKVLLDRWNIVVLVLQVVLIIRLMHRLSFHYYIVILNPWFIMQVPRVRIDIEEDSQSREMRQTSRKSCIHIVTSLSVAEENHGP